MPSPTLNRRQWTAIAVAAVVVLAVVVIALLAGGDGDDSDAATDTTIGAVTTTESTVGTAPGTSASATTTSGPVATTAGDSSTDETSEATVATTAPGPTSPPATLPASPDSLVTVPDGTIAVAEPIDTDELGDFGTGVTAEIARLEAVDGVAELPGEISGPAIRVTVRLTNGSAGALDLARVQVDLNSGADRAPGIALGEPGGAPFTGTLEPGRSAEGVYVYGVPLDRRDQVQILVLYSVDAPMMVFEGPAPTA